MLTAALTVSLLASVGCAAVLHIATAETSRHAAHRPRARTLIRRLRVARRALTAARASFFAVYKGATDA